MGSGTTETWSRHFVREPKGSPPSAVPFRGPKRIWDIKYGYSTFRNRLRAYETLLFPYGWKPYKYGRKWRIDSCGIHQDKKTAERTTIFCFVVVSGTQRGEKLTTSSERVDRDRATEEIWHRLKGTLETNTASNINRNLRLGRAIRKKTRNSEVLSLLCRR